MFAAERLEAVPEPAFALAEQESRLRQPLEDRRPSLKPSHRREHLVQHRPPCHRELRSVGRDRKPLGNPRPGHKRDLGLVPANAFLAGGMNGLRTFSASLIAIFIQGVRGESELHRADGTVAVFGDDDFREALHGLQFVLAVRDGLRLARRAARGGLRNTLRERQTRQHRRPVRWSRCREGPRVAVACRRDSRPGARAGTRR